MNQGRPADRSIPTDAHAAPVFYSAIAFALAGVLVADLCTPLGITAWVLYLVPTALALWSRRAEVPAIVAGAATACVIVGLFGSSSGVVSFEIAAVNRLLGLSTIWATAVIGYYFIRTRLALLRQEWVRAGQVGLNAAMGGEQRLQRLGEAVLRYLAEYLDAQAGAFYARDGETFRRAATYGVPAGGAPEEVRPDDGLLAQAARDNRPFVLHDVPDGYLTVGSALGRGSPRHLIIVPAAEEGTVAAVIELGFVRPLDGQPEEFLEAAAGPVAVAVRTANYRARLQALLEETQRQAAELQAQGEELRVSNEELEEQGRALEESQARLEQQQAELEQTNAQLEEHAQLLQSQKDELGRAKASLEKQAEDLAQASQYKSDFLANMSHELRTPLNSSLILSKLLADNKDGNLSAEQVKFAQTIHAAGNDLLALINDILDLSKIEAGKMEVRPGPVHVTKLLESLAQVFRPMAAQKKLELAAEAAPGCPENIETDRQRLEQVLKNLLSNALKFTDRGRVSLRAGLAPGGRVSFAVSDTGVGIPAHLHELVFEAFRQGDGTASRKHGGTGLGLSISRQLARLLGGDLHLTSEPGKGSTFTLTLPAVYAAPEGPPPEQPAPAPPPPALPAPPAPAVPAELPPPDGVEDDRARLNGQGRLLLVVEDDLAFARVLYDLAHEHGFQCVIATTAGEALAAAARYRPSAVVLDVGLPDHSGLTVLDRLKQSPATRHVPVHVVSAADHAQTALSLGAAGYLLKPVKHEELGEALRGLEARLSRRVSRVLVVEDDAGQREALRGLLATDQVEVVGAASAAECLALLGAGTFDCMVLDLSLPDASGYSLLETLSAEGAYSFPPVIVYTGRDLQADEEVRLRRYSRSIIIKGARSPERLVDEVALFLHQVVTDLPPEKQRLLEKARGRDAALEGRRVLVVEDDVRNVFALSSILEPRGASVQIARNGREALEALEASAAPGGRRIDLVLMDVMMPEMDGLTATREIRKRPGWARLPVIVLTAKAMPGDQQKCLDAGASDYIAKPLDVEKLLSLVRVWMPR